MVFSSIEFLFYFLPIFLMVYAATPRKWKNAFLFFASVLFYAWGSGYHTALFLISIVLNWLFGIAIATYRDKARWVLGIAVGVNLAILGYFKYFNFFLEQINMLPGVAFALKPIMLPLGISFFTFHAISYLTEVYRRRAPYEKSFINLGTYISCFPQLVAGPIVLYSRVKDQIPQRRVTIDMFFFGMLRFSQGLGKKVLLANPMGYIADLAFKSHDGLGIATASAWFGIMCYTFQIYFDFSGYSDMAIGLGKMIGFSFPENFNQPYRATSIQGFWRRWHMTLSEFFRDCVYIPLGGNRISPSRTYLNLAIVFFLTGLWHGAAWNFVIWGMLHGLVITGERYLLNNPHHRIAVFLHQFGQKMPLISGGLCWIYTILAVMVAWVFFRAPTVADALTYLHSMFSLHEGHTLFAEPSIIWRETYITIALCTFFALIPFASLHRFRVSEPILVLATGIASVTLLVLSAIFLSNVSFNPFIYFRF